MSRELLNFFLDPSVGSTVIVSSYRRYVGGIPCCCSVMLLTYVQAYCCARINTPVDVHGLRIPWYKNCQILFSNFTLSLSLSLSHRRRKVVDIDLTIHERLSVITLVPAGRTISIYRVAQKVKTDADLGITVLSRIKACQ